MKLKILQSYYNAIFYKDIVERFNIRNISLLDTFIKYHISIFQNIVVFQKFIII